MTVLASVFVAQVRRQGQVTAQMADTDILSVAAAEIQARYVPLLRSMQGEYLVVTQTLSPDTVLPNRIRLPSRAVGAALRLVQVQVGRDWVSLPLVSLDQVQSASGGKPQAYAIDAGTLVLVPEGSSASVRVKFEARPNSLVLESSSNVGAIGTVTPSGTGYAINVPAAINTAVDVLSAGPAHELLAYDLAMLGGNATASTPFGPIAVGDYVAPVGKTPFVPLPEELAGPLVHRVAGTILRALGYLNEAGANESRADDLEDIATLLLAPRQEGNPHRLTGGIRAGIGQVGAGRFWRP